MPPRPLRRTRTRTRTEQEQEQQQQQHTSHAGKLLATTLEIVSILRLHSVEDGAGNGILDAEDGAGQLDLAGGVAAQATGGLSATPGLGRAGLAALVGRRGPVREAAIVGRAPVLESGAAAGVGCTVIGVVVRSDGSRSIGGVGLGQTVGRDGPSRGRRHAPVRVLERTTMEPMRIVMQQRALGLVVLVGRVLLPAMSARRTAGPSA